MGGWEGVAARSDCLEMSDDGSLLWSNWSSVHRFSTGNLMVDIPALRRTVDATCWNISKTGSNSMDGKQGSFNGRHPHSEEDKREASII